MNELLRVSKFHLSSTSIQLPKIRDKWTVLLRLGRFKFRYLFIYLSRYLDQKTAKWPFRSSSRVATCYYQSNHSKVKAINPVKCLAQGHN